MGALSHFSGEGNTMLKLIFNRRLIAALGLAFSVACGPISTKDIPTSPVPSGTISSTPATQTPATPTPATPAQDRITITGRLVVVTGDPPPDSGLPARRNYSLTDQQGQRWTLTFDESVYPPPGAILSFNGKQVEVQGRRTEVNRLRVESMRLL